MKTFHLLFEDKNDGNTKIKTPNKYIIGINLSIYYIFFINSLTSKSPYPFF